MSESEPSFEDALQKLERIVQEIEEGKIGLQESIQRYAEGMKLLKHCRRVLSEAEMKIQKLQEAADGDVQIEPLGNIPE